MLVPGPAAFSPRKAANASAAHAAMPTVDALLL
jgi:hypothetical protein